MNTISTIIFDLGRVLVNIDFDAFPHALGLFTQEDRAPFRLPVAEASHLYETGKISTDEFTSQLKKIFNHQFSKEQLLTAWNEIIQNDVVEINELVLQLQKKYTTAMLSNTCSSHFHKAQATTENANLFSKNYLSYQIGYMKPAREVYEHILRDINIPANQILFVDDLQENIDAAKAVGMQGLVFKNIEQFRTDIFFLM